MLTSRKIVPLLGGAVVFPVAMLTACSGGTGVPIGGNSEELRNVDPGTVASAVVTSCSSTHAHPNVCCKGDANEPSSCVAYVNSPFHPCEDGWGLYPDPTSCCDLNDPKSCAAPPPPVPAPPVSCGYACAPGWWPVVNSPGECCKLLPSLNGLECTQSDWGYTGPISCGGSGPVYTDAGHYEPDDAGAAPDARPPWDGGGGSPVDAGAGEPLEDGGAYPPIIIDAGGGYPIEDGGAYPPIEIDGGGGYPIEDSGPVYFDAGPNCPLPPPPSWPQPVCNLSCPPGFASLPSDPSVCCSTGVVKGSRPVCFSQATGPAFPVRSKSTSK
jgi:hypothetical protein